MIDPQQDWFQESLYAGWRQAFLVESVLYRARTDHQDLAIFQTSAFGRVLALDGVIQVTEGDEYVYHEMLAHVPILAHGSVKSVCVVGGGDGGMLREVLKHRGVERCTVVEIDGGVVELSKRYLPSISAGAFDDPRSEIIIADGLKFMKETDRKFDVIVIDSTDPIGPGGVLFTEDFYKDCARCLTEDGIVVNQNGVPFMQPEEIGLTYRHRRPHFQETGFFLAAVPTYVGGMMALGWASASSRPRFESLQTIRERFAKAPFQTRYWTPEVHMASFALPKFIQELVDRA